MNKSKSIKNTNTNNIKINIGSTTKQTRRNNNNNKSYGTSKNIQNTSAPYPVYNQARQSGYPSSSTTIINPPQLQPQNNFTQKDLTNIKDEILAKLNQPLQATLGCDPDFRNDIEEMKEAHKRAKDEREFERKQKEMIPKEDMETQEIFKIHLPRIQYIIKQDNQVILLHQQQLLTHHNYNHKIISLKKI